MPKSKALNHSPTYISRLVLVGIVQGVQANFADFNHCSLIAGSLISGCRLKIGSAAVHYKQVLVSIVPCCIGGVTGRAPYPSQQCFGLCEKNTLEETIRREKWFAAPVIDSVVKCSSLDFPNG